MLLKKKEIGSYFNIPFNLIFKKKINCFPKTILLSSGRDCLSYIIESNKWGCNNRILMPSYLCESILEPFKKKKIKIIFYKIKKSMEIDHKDLKLKISKGKFDAILTIDYFGLIKQELQKFPEKEKIIHLNDQVQSFLSNTKKEGDYIFNSYRKFLCLPDGSYLKVKNKSKEQIKLKRSIPHSLFIVTKLISGLLKNIPFLKLMFRALFEISEKKLINYDKPAKMSKISKILLSRTNFVEIKKKRRENYLFLNDKIKEMKNIKPLISKIKAEDCPIGFPIICKNRDKLKKHLIKNKIYPPIHWNLPKEINKKEFKDSWNISKNILTIPIDQRYDEKDMQRIVNVINKYE
jgi:dTDP-4-amino-4,6-dideoxygalactose transaminase